MDLRFVVPDTIQGNGENFNPFGVPYAFSFQIPGKKFPLLCQLREKCLPVDVCSKISIARKRETCAPYYVQQQKYRGFRPVFHKTGHFRCKIYRRRWTGRILRQLTTKFQMFSSGLHQFILPTRINNDFYDPSLHKSQEKIQKDNGRNLTIFILNNHIMVIYQNLLNQYNNIIVSLRASPILNPKCSCLTMF